MKKVLFFSIVMGVSFFANAETKPENTDIEELVREHNGKIEEFEHRIKNIENRLNIDASDSVAFGKPTQVTEETIKGKTPEAVINLAKDYIRMDQNENARTALDLYIKNNPKDIYFGMMHYFIGKTYFLDKKYIEASKSFMQSFEINPNSRKAPNSLYKLALCFLRLNKKDQMKITLEKLVSTYPGSKKAKKAKEMLNK